MIVNEQSFVSIFTIIQETIRINRKHGKELHFALSFDEMKIMRKLVEYFALSIP